MRKFEWDEKKNKSNQKKHNVSFEDISDVFDDKRRLQAVTTTNDERRYITIGKVVKVIVTVVYTIRNFAYRIISARPSRKDERKRYIANSLTKQDQDYDQN